MLYQAAKSELQSPPGAISLLAMAFEAAGLVSVAMLLTWMI
jgi:hypothetical protein